MILELALSTPVRPVPPGPPTSGADRPRPTLLVQITDPHLCAGNGLMLGVDTEASLRAVLAQIARDHGVPDLLLATGDLSQDGSAASYQRFAAAIDAVGMPVRCLPGNHDDPAMLARTLGAWADPVTDAGPWRVVLLNSTVAGSNAGRLERDQLELLDTALAEAAGRPAVVALHHNAVQMTPDWHDTMMLENAADLFRRLHRWPNVRVLLWGHVHQEFDRRRGNMRLLATPSTCFQFTIRDGRHGLDTLAPGYRWFKLYPDGSIATGVRRLDAALWQAMLADWAQLEAGQAA